jgi:hypothetical protein
MIDKSFNNKLEKEKWSKPNLSILGFKYTEGGNNPEPTEDTSIDSFHDTPS